ncbi:hypothetical protein ACQKFM_01865 [Paenibacillus xylanexedens]|uniref:hypothetical protein n=1 Tax=Paenibacillus xylanexedens TaxID=528191 RepID=UPI003D073F1B
MIFIANKKKVITVRENFSQKELFDHIGKLQDRERQKITSMGLSNWVLFATIGALGYLIFPGIGLIRDNIPYTLLCYVLFMNLVVAIFDVFNRRFRQDKIVNFRDRSSILALHDSRLILRDFELFQNIISFILNIIVLCLYPQLWIVLVIFIHRYLTSLGSAIYLLIKPLPEALRKRKRGYSSYSIFLVISSVLPFLFVFVFGQDNYFSDENLKLSLYGFVLVLITMLFQMLFVIFSKRMKIGWLESLEKEIILNNLPATSIHAKLKDYYKFSQIDDYF